MLPMKRHKILLAVGCVIVLFSMVPPASAQHRGGGGRGAGRAMSPGFRPGGPAIGTRGFATMRGGFVHPTPFVRSGPFVHGGFVHSAPFVRASPFVRGAFVPGRAFPRV